MNQNVYGMFLFSAIVGAAVFIDMFAVALPEPPAIESTTVYTRRAIVTDRGCFKDYKKKPKRPKKPKFEVTQVVFNTNTKKRTTQLKWDNADSTATTISEPLVFHFFQKTSAGFEYLNSDKLFLPLEIEIDSGTSEILSSYSWLDSRSNYNNLYLMIETDNQPFSNRNEEISFDEAKAEPILLNFGKK